MNMILDMDYYSFYLIIEYQTLIDFMEVDKYHILYNHINLYTDLYHHKNMQYIFRFIFIYYMLCRYI